MSSFSFSHQFSQHWITTLPAVKNAIIQELDDIAKLLHPDTVLSDYEFSVPNLNHHVEEITTQENARLAKIKAEQEEQQRLENERLEQERLMREQAERAQEEQLRREQMRLENERLEQIRLEKERLEQQRLAREKQEQQEASRLENERQEFDRVAEQTSITSVELLPKQIDNNVSDEIVPNSSNEPLNLSHSAKQKTTAHFANMANPIFTSALPYDKIKQEITANLTQQMEDYIQESMQIIRDDLRPWLEAEVEKQLAEHLKHEG